MRNLISAATAQIASWLHVVIAPGVMEGRQTQKGWSALPRVLSGLGMHPGKQCRWGLLSPSSHVASVCHNCCFNSFCFLLSSGWVWGCVSWVYFLLQEQSISLDLIPLTSQNMGFSRLLCNLLFLRNFKCGLIWFSKKAQWHGHRRYYFGQHVSANYIQWSLSQCSKWGIWNTAWCLHIAGDLLVVAIITLIVLCIQIGEMRLETGEATLSNSQSIKAWTLSPKTVFGSVLQ